MVDRRNLHIRQGHLLRQAVLLLVGHGIPTTEEVVDPFQLVIGRHVAIEAHRYSTSDLVTSQGVSSRLDKSWLVLASHQMPDASRCVDIFSRPDGSFGFEEFRRDPEDLGVWTPISYYSGREYPTETGAVEAARQSTPWLSTLLDSVGGTGNDP